MDMQELPRSEDRMAILAYSTIYIGLLVGYIASYITDEFAMHFPGCLAIIFGSVIVMCLCIHLYHYLGGEL